VECTCGEKAAAEWEMATDITKAQTQEFMNIPNLITKVFLNVKPFRGTWMKTKTARVQK